MFPHLALSVRALLISQNLQIDLAGFHHATFRNPLISPVGARSYNREERALEAN